MKTAYKLSTMPRKKFEKLGDKLKEESSRITTELIEAGYGNARHSDLVRFAKEVRDNKLLNEYFQNSEILSQWYAEYDYRLRMHGKLAPWIPKN